MKKSTLQRMLQLADIKPVIKESKMTLSNFELVKKSVDGKTYAIVRENKRYHIKQAETKNNLTESDFDYVGGVMNKMKKSFSSFSDATKHLNLMFEEINNHYDVNSINLLESDEVLSEKKFVLKMNKKKAPKPAEEEPSDEGGFDFGGGDTEGDTEGEEFDFGGEETEGEEFDFGGEDTEGDTEGEEFDFGGGDTEEDVEEFDTEGDEDLDMDSEDEIKDIQSTTGKLGQQLRDVEDISSDMMKWVAKSVLSALDLDNMDSEDKKDIIRTVKTKSEEEETEEEEVGSDEEFDFDTEEEIEESYDSYMDDEDPFDGMDRYLNPSNKKEMSYYEDEDVTDEFPSHSDVYGNTKESYDSYMEDNFNEKRFDSWMEDMESMGILNKPYQSYMEDRTNNKYKEKPYGEDNPNIGGDEDVPMDKLLFDSEYEDTNNNPNIGRKYSRSNMDRARRDAEKDITKHYHRPAAPGYDERPSDDWAKHKLPYDTNFMWESKSITEDHLNDQMETYEQEKAYEDVETFVRRYGLDVNLRNIEKTEDPEETTVYLDIVDGSKKLLVARINSVGQIEVGEMTGKNFVGEPVDSVEDFVEIFGEDLTNKEKDNLKMNQPKRSPEKQPSEPTTKPGKPDRKSPSERPSRRPFTAPPHITPGEEPGPKARERKSYMSEYDMDPTMSPSPAPSKPTPSKEPDTKPGKPDKKPGTDRPSRRPFTAPPHITPGEEPGPKADYEDDVEFE
jgi:hypothetical protein